MENNELAVLNSIPNQPDLISTKEKFEHAQRIAMMFSKSELIPKRYQGNIGNCVIALEMAHRMGASPLMVMQNLDIIMGRPAWSSTFLIATLNASGKFSPLRYEHDEKDGGRVRAWAIDKINNEKVYGVWVSMAIAKAEGWIDKPGSKWKTMPELMMRYRAASFFTKQFAPEISMGLQTMEEEFDIHAQRGGGGFAADILTTLPSSESGDNSIEPTAIPSETNQKEESPATLSETVKTGVAGIQDADALVTYANNLTHLHQSGEFVTLVNNQLAKLAKKKAPTLKLIF